MSGDSQPNDLFIGLVASLQASAWMQLGKILNPVTGKVERDLEQARDTIDLLGMLEAKTRGNLHPDESRLLTQTLYALRMNYVEEERAASAGSSGAVDPAEPAGPAEPAAP